MKVKDILGPALGVASAFVPGLAPIAALVNPFLAEGDKIPEGATADQIERKIQSLPPDQRAMIYNADIDLQKALDVNWTLRYEAMCKADTQQSRAFIAKLMGIIVALIDGMCGLAYAIAIFESAEPLKDLGATWPVITAILAVPAVLLKAYFGILAKEQGQRLGIPQSPLGGLIDLIKGK